MKEITKEELKHKTEAQIESLKSEYETSLKISKAVHVTETIFDYLFLGLAVVCLLVQNYSFMATCFLMCIGCKVLEFGYKKEAKRKQQSINNCEEELKIRKELKNNLSKENLETKQQSKLAERQGKKIEDINLAVDESDMLQL